ncbi:transcription termination/antitermination protein NusA, partial [Acinetobacter baumannii]
VALGVTDDLAAVEGLTLPMLVQLGENGVKTLDDLADLAGDELTDIVQGALDLDDANAIIMAAREHWFAEEGGEDEGSAPDAGQPN